MRVAIVAHRSGPANLALTGRLWNGAPLELLTPLEALIALAPGDIALNRLDVRDELDGVEDGLPLLEQLRDSGVRVLNPPAALLRAHDKLLTAQTLRAAGVPHPKSVLVERPGELPEVDYPVVLKPRFGSWGRDVMLCETPAELEQALDKLSHRPWFGTGGLLAQELIPPLGHDLRLIVAASKLVGGARRDAQPGEWRTNVALGASITPMMPPPVAAEVALRAAAASGLDLVGVDLLPTGPGGFCVVELNGAVDFRPVYSFEGRDVFDDTIAALGGGPALDVGAVAAAPA